MENILSPVLNADLIASSHDAVDAMKTAAGMTDAQFAALCMPILRAYADHVQRLPLTAGAFASANGAWEFGLTAATVAYRYAGTVIFFPTLGAEARRMLEPQCRYMAFLATLSSAVAMVAESSSLTAGEDEYHPLSVDGTLFAWLSGRSAALFSWRVPAGHLSVPAGAAIAANFIPKRLLANFDLRAILMLYEAINPKTTMNGVESTLARVVRQSVQGVLDHYKSKQAGTFLPEPSALPVSPTESLNVAAKLIAVANPTVIPNPLDTPHEAPKAAAQLATSAKLSAPSSVPPHSGPAQTMHAAAAVASQAITGDANDAEEKLARGHKVLREWFSALAQHPQFHVLKDQLVMTAEGIEVPVSMLGMFGVSGASVRGMMVDAGLILGRTANARGVILHPGLRDRFVN